jgi:hypothetical protein
LTLLERLATDPRVWKDRPTPEQLAMLERIRKVLGAGEPRCPASPERSHRGYRESPARHQAKESARQSVVLGEKYTGHGHHRLPGPPPNLPLRKGEGNRFKSPPYEGGDLEGVRGRFVTVLGIVKATR